MKKIIVLILTMATLPGTVFASMVENDSFEDGGTYPDAWSEWSCSVSSYCDGDGTTNYRDAEGIARTGDDCMEAVGDNYAFSYQDHGESATDTGSVPVVVGQDYTVAAYFKDIHSGGSTSQVEVQLEYRDGSRSEAGEAFQKERYQTAIPNDGEWHLVYLTFNTPATTELITICVGKYDDGEGTYLYDDVWFDTTPPPFGSQAMNPTPSSGAINVPITVVLEWDPPQAFDPCAYDVYISSTDPNADKVKDQVVNHVNQTTYDDPCDLDYNTKYYWRVNAYDPCDVIRSPGAVWSFTTLPVEPVFTTDAESTTVEAGSSAQIYVQTPRSNTFQWYKEPATAVNHGDGGGDVSVVSDPCSSTLTISNVEQADEDYYYCVATGTGSTESNHARLLTKRLMGNWKFDTPPANLLLDEVAGNHGTLVDPNVLNPPPTFPSSEWLTSGIVGNAAIKLTSGEVYVDIPNEEYFNFHAQGFTVSAWVQTEQTDWGVIVSKTDRLQPRTGWLLHHNGDSAYMNLRGDGEVSYNAGLTDNEWHMLTGTYDSDTGMLALYVDGEKRDEDGPIWDLTETDMPLKIGTELSSDHPGDDSIIDYDGSIDDVQILSYPQDAYEIATAYTDYVEDASICVEPVEGDQNDDCVISTADLVEGILDWLACGLVPAEACD